MTSRGIAAHLVRRPFAATVAPCHSKAMLPIIATTATQYRHQSTTEMDQAIRDAPQYPTAPASMANATAADDYGSSAYGGGASSSSSTEAPASDASSGRGGGVSSWKDYFAHLPIFGKYKMTRNGTDFDMLPDPRIIPRFKFFNRFYYSSPFRTQKLEAFLKVESGQMLSICTTYQHQQHPDLVVTLVPISHAGHPQFYYQVDLLLCQHDSVLMEGRVPFKQAPFSTLVPPRPLPNQVRPVDLEETVQQWEPKDLSAYWQPFSWGVRDSPNYTVIHAADKYDYEKLPMLAALRWNMPLIGSFQREVHCLSMIPFLVDNGYKKFAVPWGAAHMPIMHEMLEHNGFQVVSATAMPIFDEADGEISQGHVRSAAKLVANHENREDLWMAAILSIGAAIVIYFTGRVEVNGVDVATGRPTDINDKTFAHFGRDKPFEEMADVARKSTSEFTAKFGH